MRRRSAECVVMLWLALLAARPAQSQTARGIVWTDSAAARAGALLPRGDTVAAMRALPAAPAKDPMTALLFGVVMPGMGNVYAGNAGKGVALFAATWGSVLYARSALRSSCTGSASGASCARQTNATVGDVVALAAWAYGWLTAPGDARATDSAEGCRVSLAPRGRGLTLAVRTAW